MWTCLKDNWRFDCFFLNWTGISKAPVSLWVEVSTVYKTIRIVDFLVNWVFCDNMNKGNEIREELKRELEYQHKKLGFYIWGLFIMTNLSTI